MKTNKTKKAIISKLATFTLLSVGLLAIMACASNTMKAEEEIDVTEMADGVIVVDTLTLNATVVAKDAVKRTITLASTAGGKTTYKAGPEMNNFDQINVGDQVLAVVTEEVAAYIGEGEPPSEAAAGGVMVASDGSSAAGMVVATQQFNVVVEAVNSKKHKITLQLPDGTSKTVKVNKKVDLSIFQPGDDLSVVLGEGVALSIQNP